MPISKDRFEEIRDSGDTGGPSPGTNPAKILNFLRENPDKAFTQSEIADKTGVKSGSVGPTLVRLRERGRVDHHGTYWRISDHDQSVAAATNHSGAAVAAREDTDDTPQLAEWKEHAVDPRTDRNE